MRSSELEQLLANLPESTMDASDSLEVVREERLAIHPRDDADDPRVAKVDIVVGEANDQ